MSEHTNGATAPTVITAVANGLPRSVDVAALPQTSLLMLCRKGLAHFLGNEQSSKVTAFKEPKDGASPPSEAEIKAFHEAKIEEAIAALAAGTVGEGRASGPRLDPIEKEMRNIAEREVLGIIKANNIPFKKGVATFGDGQEKSLATMVKARLEAHGERLRKEATAAIKAAERQAKAAAESAAKAAPEMGAAEAFGL